MHSLSREYLQIFLDIGENKFYSSFGLGVELFKFKFIAPEVSIEYMGGSLENQETTDPENPRVNLNFTSAGINGFIYSAAPKLISSFDDGSAFLIPKFSLAHAEAYAAYFENDGADQYYLRREHVSAKDTFYYLSVDLGIELYLPDSDSWSMAIYLSYTSNPSGKLFDKLEFENYDAYIPGENLETVGLGLRLYYDPFEKR